MPNAAEFLINTLVDFLQESTSPNSSPSNPARSELV
jgi:hypothetical protein